MLKITLLNTYRSKCSLGEGLLLGDHGAAWVDINSHLIFIADAQELLQYSTRSTPSIVLEVNQNDIQFGSDDGLCSLCKKTGKEIKLLAVPHTTAAYYRSNDGCCCGADQLLGFMHRHNPSDNAGYVYRISGASWDLLDTTIHIPNTFVEIEPSKILISDSLKGQIWLFDLDLNGNLSNKTLWAQLETGVAPDGGCLVSDCILIALWDTEKSQLWVTSASEGLSQDLLKEYPDSGNTFVFDLEFL